MEPNRDHSTSGEMKAAILSIRESLQDPSVQERLVTSVREDQAKSDERMKLLEPTPELLGRRYTI